MCEESFYYFIIPLDMPDDATKHPFTSVPDVPEVDGHVVPEPILEVPMEPILEDPIEPILEVPIEPIFEVPILPELGATYPGGIIGIEKIIESKRNIIISERLDRILYLKIRI